jgi:hypothetical protein
MIKTCSLYLINIQIWRNLPGDDRHFFYVFPWMIATLATNKNSLKINTRVRKKKEEVKEKREVESEPTQHWLQLSSAILYLYVKEPTISFEM